MPKLCRAGMATSARHVVGLHDPPKNTSGPLLLNVPSSPFPGDKVVSYLTDSCSFRLHFGDPSRGGGVFERPF